MSKNLLSFSVFFALSLSGCANFPFHRPEGKRPTPPSTSPEKTVKPRPRSLTLSRADKLAPGELVIIQTATSENVTHFNVLSPRYKNFRYVASSVNGHELTVERLETIQYAPVFYKVDKLRVKGMSPGTTYQLKVFDTFRQSTTLVDERNFSGLNVGDKKAARFALVSCMSDDWRFDSVIDPIWAQLAKQNPDFVILNGDVVYVDRFGLVERGLATEQDLWQRYIDSFRRIPYFHSKTLLPTFATWDDHDYGTNDGDRTFTGKQVARRVFHAFFGASDIPKVFQNGPEGTYSVFSAFGQRFYLMDNRSYRQPNKNQQKPEPFAHWGETQHQWLVSSLNSGDVQPSWLINGSQFFDGKHLEHKESFEGDHPLHFHRLLEDLKKIKSPVVFASGDVHFSEVMKIAPQRGLGYETYEVTSSAMHSYASEPWENPLRIKGAMTSEFNFLIIQSRADHNKVRAKIRSLGTDPEDYFQTEIDVEKKPEGP